jgi:hypothetical protein
MVYREVGRILSLGLTICIEWMKTESLFLTSG